MVVWLWLLNCCLILGSERLVSLWYRYIVIWCVFISICEGCYVDECVFELVDVCGDLVDVVV